VREAERIALHPDFRGTIHDVGGPTANMYAIECDKKQTRGACADRRCLFPEVCPSLRVDHSRQIALLRRLRQVPGVKHVFVGSGIRHDLVLADAQHGQDYLAEIVRHHVSGQLKVAPEHSEARVLRLMGKPDPQALLRFKALFDRLTEAAGRDQYLTCYLIAAHPGCTEQDMQQLAQFFGQRMGFLPEQVQIFTPLPSTYSALMYHTGIDPFTGNAIFVERGLAGREQQKDIVTEAARERQERGQPGGRPQTKRQRTARRSPTVRGQAGRTSGRRTPTRQHRKGSKR